MFSPCGDLFSIGSGCVKQWDLDLNCNWSERCLYHPERIFVTESGVISIQLENKGMQIRNALTKKPVGFLRGKSAISYSGKKLLQQVEHTQNWTLYNCTLGAKQQKSARK